MKWDIILFVIFIVVMGVSFVEIGHKEIQGNGEIGSIEIYHRGLDTIGHDNVSEGPHVHPILKMWDGQYSELDNYNGKIIILMGNKSEMSGETQNYLKDGPDPEEVIEVDKGKFLKAVEEFKEKHEGTEYHVLDFRDNCIGFKDFVVKKSQIT